MENIEEHIKDLILGCLNEELTAQEQAELEQWLANSQDHRDYFNDWNELWFSASHPAADALYNKDKAFEAFLSRIGQLTPSAFRWTRLIPYAAAAAVILLVGVISFRSGMKTVKSEFADIAVEAPMGSRTKLNLPDGSLVWLNAGSRLSYSQGFGVDDRRVSLTGEGYFEITKNARLPFQVSSASLDVKVLGTKFNFCDYPNEQQAVVTLMEGKVALSDHQHASNTYYLSPGNRAVYDKSRGAISMDRCEARLASIWTQGQLQFDDLPLKDIVNLLQRNYDVKITVSTPQLYEYSFYGDFSREKQSIEEVLRMLSMTGKLRYKIKGRQITLY